MGQWCWYGQKGERAAQIWKGGNVPFWERAQTGFSMALPKAIALVVLKTSHAVKVTVECISNVIYQNAYLIRLINVSAFLSNQIALIYQIAR